MPSVQLNGDEENSRQPAPHRAVADLEQILFFVINCSYKGRAALNPQKTRNTQG